MGRRLGASDDATPGSRSSQPKQQRESPQILRFGRTRTNIGFDIYNILNGNPILTYNQAFNPVISTTNPSSNWLAPQSTLQPRFLKFSAQIDF